MLLFIIKEPLTQFLNGLPLGNTRFMIKYSVINIIITILTGYLFYNNVAIEFKEIPRNPVHPYLLSPISSQAWVRMVRCYIFIWSLIEGGVSFITNPYFLKESHLRGFFSHEKGLIFILIVKCLLRSHDARCQLCIIYISTRGSWSMSIAFFRHFMFSSLRKPSRIRDYRPWCIPLQPRIMSIHQENHFISVKAQR